MPQLIGTLADAIGYLHSHPRIRFQMHDPAGRTPDQDEERRFLRHARGGLWFEGPRGEGFIPINCGLVAAETGIEFEPHGLRIEKFGATITLEYLDGPLAVDA